VERNNDALLWHLSRTYLMKTTEVTCVGKSVTTDSNPRAMNTAGVIIT
jgi:hypothetical protein